MKTMLRMLSFTCLFVLLASSAVGEEKEGADQSRSDQEKSDFTLKLRQDNGAYRGSEFSFRTNSQDIEKHQNYVDLIYNGCGTLHFNPVGQMANRVADLGEMEFADAPKKIVGDEDWHQISIEPQEGHVYTQIINAQGQKMLVQFRVDKVEQDSLAISWRTIEKLKGRLGNRGRAGTMGQCGGQHQSK